MTTGETLGQPEYTVPEPTLQDLTSYIDGYLLHDKRATKETLEDGSVKSNLWCHGIMSDITLSSTTSPEGTTSHNYALRQGFGSLMGSAMRTSLEWTASSDVAALQHIQWGEIDDSEATGADYRTAFKDIAIELDRVEEPLLYRILNRA